MDRRSLLKLLSCVPLLGWLKPEPCCEHQLTEFSIGVDMGDGCSSASCFTTYYWDERERAWVHIKPEIPYWYSSKPVIRNGQAVIVSWRPGIDDEPV